MTYYESCAADAARVLCHVAFRRHEVGCPRESIVRELADLAMAYCNAFDPAALQRLLIKREVNP